ncbi:MoxR family ATPase [Opitutaceae bacterium TAV4]|uniref:AAA family ATPase n=1 Tax=Geminisphaera colitermitum TaxID=1148786 RepID=UPI000158D4D9|nr:MoxR family ATPase [Geminisphaera colitermitum]RRJ94373.1 MoxR family ATPase [Opitutaceae bacterium TAV4]RRJ98463.1 MoxR family ATPase [Opitutaceae bacterium TAV3]
MSSSPLEHFSATLAAARAEIGKVIIGQQAVVDLALITLLARQHALIEGVPGIAKTLLVRTLGHVLGVPSGRVQFTPDLMPADITGTNVFNLQTNSFTLVRGPVFTTFLLGDEINRAPAKTQAALLQAMQERTVTIDRDTHALDDNFTVFATQNPADSEGTYPLPEAQKDRFMLKIQMEPPARDDELALARRMIGLDGATSPESALAGGAVRVVLAPGELTALRGALDAVTLRDELIAYIVDLVRATRSHESVLVGAGPRATQALLLASRARAAIDGRDFVTPDDARGLAAAVLGHRLVLRPEFEIEGLTIDEVLARILEQVAVPR